MTAPDEILASYEALLRYSHVMLSHARTGDWDALLASETRYVVQVETLARLEQGVTMSGEHADRKADLLAAILRNDLEVRECLVARRNELGELIQTSQTRRELHRSYGGNISPMHPPPEDSKD